MHLRTWTGMALAACVASLAALPVVALSGPGRGPMGEGRSLARFVERNAEAIGLDPATRSQIEAIGEREATATRALHDSLRTERKRLRELLEADAPDVSLVTSQADVMGELRTSIQKERLRTLIEIRDLLSPEQEQKLRELRKEKRRDRFERRRERRQTS